MSRLYDTVEPNVIDEDMLQKAVEEQGPKEEAGKIAKEEGIDFADVQHLRLDFKSEPSDFFQEADDIYDSHCQFHSSIHVH